MTEQERRLRQLNIPMKIAIGTLKMKKTYGRHGDSTWTSAHAMKIALKKTMPYNAAIQSSAAKQYLMSCMSILVSMFMKSRAHLPPAVNMCKVSFSLLTSESNYSFNVLWPTLEFAVNSLDNDKLSFICGEHVLVSSSEEYKADGVIILDETIEICLLEVSGKYESNDIPRFSYDHVKGCFGVLSMLNNIIKAYHKAAITLRVPFVHARGESIYLWSLEVCNNKLYAFQKIYEAKVPFEWLDQAEVLSFGVFVWLLRNLLSKLVESIEAMAREHDKARIGKLLGLKYPGEDLLDFVNTSLKKPARGASYGVLLPQDDQCEATICMSRSL
ncbi:hypothetical protein G6F43_007109 [Rhizopus delemar]|nr:hypothetical protein G6F43_007109 [Rhizopus delemar]